MSITLDSGVIRMTDHTLKEIVDAVKEAKLKKKPAAIVGSEESDIVYIVEMGGTKSMGYKLWDEKEMKKA